MTAARVNDEPVSSVCPHIDFDEMISTSQSAYTLQGFIMPDVFEAVKLG